MCSAYAAPVQDMMFLLKDVFVFDDLARDLGIEDMGCELGSAILEEASKLGSEVVAPLNQLGDAYGSTLENGTVRTSEGFAEAYGQFTSGGWNGIHVAAAYGGQEIPYSISTPVSEIWCGANMAFSLLPVLTQGAIEALERHASEELKKIYLPKLVSGEWTGTMNLTEPQAGSDLSGVRTKAVPGGGHYRITGQKVFVSWGDHDLTENIIHLVLARTPGAPDGTRGISLFVVPKYLVTGDGQIGSRNDLKCISLEHKLGIHASPTAVISYGDDGGAVGYLVGEENRGLEYMFTMMNSARLSVGLEGVGIAERSCQQAHAYAEERLQGKTMVDGSLANVPISRHPDVRRMLALMRSKTEAMRALTYHVAGLRDIAERHPKADERAAAAGQVDLLTPVVKAWCTDGGLEVADLAIQVHGGVGYIEETGIAQNWRDLRVATIYEGTNGIQAIDLVNRKVVRDQGAAIATFLRDAKSMADISIAGTSESIRSISEVVLEASVHLDQAINWILEQSKLDPARCLAAASTFLTLFGTVAAGWLVVRASAAADKCLQDNIGDPVFHQDKINSGSVFARHYLNGSSYLLDRIMNGSDCLLAGAGDGR